MSEAKGKDSSSVSPRSHDSKGHNLMVPSPLPTRRTRTVSMSEKAHAGPTFIGTVKSFCREKGHGFIQPTDGSEAVFVHISDIEEDFVPKEGDEVTYKLCPIPPKMEKCSAVHVHIKHPKEGVQHERWDLPPSHGQQKDK